MSAVLTSSKGLKMKSPRSNLTLEKFADLLIKLLKNAGAKGDLLYDAKERCIVGSDHRMEITKLYRECRKSEVEAQILVADAILSWPGAGVDIPAKFDDAKDRLRAIIRPRFDCERAAWHGHTVTP
jgi:hypothetical protein